MPLEVSLREGKTQDSLLRRFQRVELKQGFTDFGEVMPVSIIKDKYSRQPRGFGFVEMSSKSEGETAITRLKGKTLRGRVIDVIEALPLSDDRDAGSFHSRRGSRFI